MSGSGRTHPIDGDLIAALLAGNSQLRAAHLLGISARTIGRRVADPGFQRRLQEAQEEAIKVVRRKITDRASHAVDALTSIARGEVTGDGAQVRAQAARALLSTFAQLQPKQWQADIYTSDVPVIDYRFEGIDPEVLR